MRKGCLFLLMLMVAGAAQVLAQATPAKTSSAPAAQAQTQDAANRDVASNDPLFDVPPLPKGKVALIGGTVRGIDQIRDHLTVEPFGGHNMKIAFDERTKIYRDGVPATQLAIRKGDRVYVDTMLDGTKVFAKNIRVVTGTAAADARGQILRYDARTGTITLQDELSSAPVNFRVTDATVINTSTGKGTVTELQPGALVTVKFSPDHRDREVAHEVSVVAAPGSSFTFYGTITYLNLSTRTLAVANESDKKTYDISFDPATVDTNALRQGAQVLVKATFNGKGYTASNLKLMQTHTP